VEPIAWFMKALKNYVGFEGRARRKEFWYYQLVAFVLGIIAATLDSILGTPGAAIGQGVLGSLLALALILPSLAVGARRLHDSGRSGWWQLLIITVIGVIVLIVFWVQDSDEGANTHGANPKLEPIPTM